MEEDAKQRITRLVAWIKIHRKDLLRDDSGAPSPSALGKATGKSPSFWSERLGQVAGKSFAAQVARDVEAALAMPPYQLEGLGWQFDEIDFDRFDRLSPSQKGRVQEAMLQKIELIERENEQRNASRAPDTASATQGKPAPHIHVVTAQNRTDARESEAHSGAAAEDREVQRSLLKQGRGGDKHVESPVHHRVESTKHGSGSKGTPKKG